MRITETMLILPWKETALFPNRTSITSKSGKAHIPVSIFLQSWPYCTLQDTCCPLLRSWTWPAASHFRCCCILVAEPPGAFLRNAEQQESPACLCLVTSLLLLKWGPWVDSALPACLARGTRLGSSGAAFWLGGPAHPDCDKEVKRESSFPICDIKTWLITPSCKWPLTYSSHNSQILNLSTCFHWSGQQTVQCCNNQWSVRLPVKNHHLLTTCLPLGAHCPPVTEQLCWPRGTDLRAAAMVCQGAEPGW